MERFLEPVPEGGEKPSYFSLFFSSIVGIVIFELGGSIMKAIY